MLLTVLLGDNLRMLSPLIHRTLRKLCSENNENRRKQSKSHAMQISIVASFEIQAKDKKEQSTHSECDPLDSNEGFDLDNSASATNLDIT